MNGQATNILAIVAVVAVVAGAAWFRSQRGQTPADGDGATDTVVAAVDTAQAPAEQVATDEPRPETVPVTRPAAAQTVAGADSPAVKAKLPRLVDLGAGKCKQCKALAPILDALREEYKGRLSVEFIDVWKKPKEAEPYNIRLIPTQILYDKDGNELWRHEGFISKEDLKKLFAEKVGVK